PVGLDHTGHTHRRSIFTIVPEVELPIAESPFQFPPPSVDGESISRRLHRHPLVIRLAVELEFQDPVAGQIGRLDALVLEYPWPDQREDDAHDLRSHWFSLQTPIPQGPEPRCELSTAAETITPRPDRSHSGIREDNALALGSRRVQVGLRRLLESSRAQALGLFQLGLRWLMSCVTHDRPLPKDLSPVPS